MQYRMADASFRFEMGSERMDLSPWISDIKGEFSASMIFQFCHLWVERLRHSMSEAPDSFRWIWTDSGTYTATTAYKAFFAANSRLLGAEQL